MPKPKVSSTGQLMSCCYVLADKTACNKPTKFRIIKDDDDNPVRKYESFCPEHKAIVDASPDSDWGWEE